MLILGIESSCDETSCAIVKDGKEVLSNVVLSQIDIFKEFGGVIPEVASRNHVLNITKIIDKAVRDANIQLKDIDLIAVTKGPGLIGSLLVGINAAETLAFTLNKPLYGVNHLIGHIYAGTLENEFNFPLLALLVSGGHTELILMNDHLSFEVLGETLDDAIGEAYDKVGRVLGLQYPSGPVIDKLAKLGKPNYELPKITLKDTYNFSFSGIKSAVVNKVHNMKQRNEEVNVNDMCYAFQETVVNTLVTQTIKAANEYNVNQIVVAGGVAANKGLREQLTKSTTKQVIFPKMSYCTDNAVMIAQAAYYMYQKNYKYDKYIDGNPSLTL